MTSALDWQPTASIEALKDRARLGQVIRQFFDARGVVEVHTPVLSCAANCDAHIAPVRATVMGRHAYLRTSPEHFHKRLLAAGSGPIFELGPVARDSEQGGRHNPEFTLLEWYRPNWDETDLIQEVQELLKLCAATWNKSVDVRHLLFEDVIRQASGVGPREEATAKLHRWAETQGMSSDIEDRDELLDFAVSVAARDFGDDVLTVISGYPASQAAQAVIEGPVARRFEVYWGSLELANGYFELTDADELTRRFAAQLEQNEQRGLPPLPVDLRLLAAMHHGLPRCAGVAMGFDRLLMALRGSKDISETMAFAYHVA